MSPALLLLLALVAYDCSACIVSDSSSTALASATLPPYPQVASANLAPLPHLTSSRLTAGLPLPAHPRPTLCVAWTWLHAGIIALASAGIAKSSISQALAYVKSISSSFLAAGALNASCSHVVISYRGQTILSLGTRCAPDQF